MNVYPLLIAVMSLYKVIDMVKSRDLLLRRLTDSAERSMKHRKVEDTLRGIYDILQSLSTEDPLVFVALALNKSLLWC